ncbi:hypothetical protein WICPIJ_008981, partial [Wickerhamomyces pijperi]
VTNKSSATLATVSSKVTPSLTSEQTKVESAPSQHSYPDVAVTKQAYQKQQKNVVPDKYEDRQLPEIPAPAAETKQNKEVPPLPIATEPVTEKRPSTKDGAVAHHRSKQRRHRHRYGLDDF